MASSAAPLAVRLRDIATFENGDRGPNYPGVADYEDGGVPFLGAVDIVGSELAAPSTRISQEAFDRLRSGKTRRGDILFCLRGSLAKTARIGTLERAAIASSLVIIRPNNRVDPDYLFYFLTSPLGQRAATSLDNGSVQPNISVRSLQEMVVPLPSLRRQREIARVLRALDQKIDSNRRMNHTLESIARAIFKSWFVDFDPVRKKMEGGDPGLPTSLAASMLATTAPSGSLSSDTWIDGELADIAELNPESWTDATLPDTVAYVDLSNVKRGRIEQVVHWMREEVPSRARRILRSGDTVVGTVRPGNQSYALISEDGLTGSTGFAVLRPKEPEYREIVYLAATAHSNIEELASLADGGAYPAVRPETVARSPVLIPPVDSGRVFSRLTAPLFDLIAVRELESRSLAVLRDALLVRLLSGALRPEAMADDLVGSGDEWLESVATTDRTAGSS